MATGNSTLVVNGLLMYVTSYISRDTIQDIQNVVHDTYDDDTVTLAKQLLWEHYSDTANLGKNTAKRSRYRHVEDIVDGNNNNNNCLKSNIQCIEIRVQWTVHLGSSHMHVHAVTRVHAVTPKLVICVMYLTSI